MQHFFASITSSTKSYKVLLVIILAALLPRLYWMHFHDSVITLEGSEYVRMADSLGQGRGLVGNFPGPETMYSPLLPVLTASLSLIIRNTELAARVLCLLFGVGLIIPVFLTARRMYGDSVAYLSAAIVGFHPLLVLLSASVYNENLYLLLLMTAIYWVMRCLESRSIKDCVLLGLFLGFAYLTRPEAFAYPILFALYLLATKIATDDQRWKVALGPAVMVAVFALVALPYVHFLYVHTGHVRLEGKWGINYTIANRIREGMTGTEAAYGLRPDGGVAGPLLDPYHFAAFSPFSESLRSKVLALTSMARRNLNVPYEMLRDHATGWPLLLVLTIIGLFREPWGTQRLRRELVLLGIAGSILFLIDTASAPAFRYILPVVPIFCIWAAIGIVEFSEWNLLTAESLRTAGRLTKFGRSGAIAFSVVPLLLMFVISFLGAKRLGYFSSDLSDLDEKEAGLWIKAHPGESGRILCNSTIITYYAHTTIIGFPDASSDRTLNYIRANKIDYVVLDAAWASFHLERDWLDHGIPDPDAHLVYDIGTKDLRRIAIYRWTSPG